MLSWMSRNRQRLVQFAGTILAIVLLVVLLRKDGWNEILAAMRRIQAMNLLLGCVNSRTAVSSRIRLGMVTVAAVLSRNEPPD